MSTPHKRAGWRKSTFSAQENGCVEVRFTDAGVEMRDTKERGAGPVIYFGAENWASLLHAVIEGGSVPGVSITEAVRAVEYGGSSVQTEWHVRVNDGPELHFTARERDAFCRGVLAGEFAPPPVLANS